MYNESTVYWDESGLELRRAVLELLNFTVNRSGLSRAGERFAHQSWIDLSPAVQNILTRAGIEQRP